MSAYNLFLLDETRDPRVIARLARVTGLPEQIVRRELRNPPFLVLREHGLSQAVAVRRDFEQMGLTLRLERVETPTGNRSHPLAGELAPEDGVEIVLEEGAGFKDAGAEPPGRTPRGLLEGRLGWRSMALALLVPLLLALGWWALRGQAHDPGLRRLDNRLELDLPQLQEALESTLAEGTAGISRADSLIRLVDELERSARPVWDELSRSQRERLEDLLARRQTLILRRTALASPPAVPVWLPGNLQIPVATGVAGEDFWERLAVQWGRRTAPVSLGEQMALERLEDELRRISAGLDAGARSRLMKLERQDPQGRRRMGAIRLAGSLRQKGVAWSGEGDARQGWADLPDSTALEVTEASGRTHVAYVRDGRVVFEDAPGPLTGVSVRLAAIERQPTGLRGMLEVGLLLFEPEVYFATLPGGTLPRLDPGLAAAQWEQSGDPALKAELQRLGLVGGDERRPILARGAALPGGEPDVSDWLRTAAERYRKARSWPESLELRTPSGRYRVTGCELWLLTTAEPGDA